MTKAPFKILLADTAYIGLNEYERILQSVVTFADVVLVPASLQLAPGIPKDARKRIIGTLNPLIEARRIVLWQYPGLGILKATKRVLSNDIEIQSIDNDAYVQFYDSVTDTVRQRIERANLLDKDHKRISHSTTEMVYFRNALWPCFLSQYFQSDRVVYNPNEMDSLLGLRSLGSYQNIEERVVSEFLVGQKLPTLSVLGADQIIDLNLHHQKFRDEVLKHTNAFSNGSIQQQELGRIVSELFDGYYREVGDLVQSKLSMKSVLIDTVKNTLLTGVTLIGAGVLVPLSLIFPFVDSPVTWLRGKQKISAVTAFTTKLRKELGDKH